MKILIGMTRTDTLASGAFKHILQIGRRFQHEGAQVAYVMGKNGPCAKVLQEQGHTVYLLPYLERDVSPLKDFISLLQLIKLILVFRPDICSWHTAKIGALGRMASALTFRKCFYVPHGVPFVDCPENKGSGVYRRLEKFLSYLPAKIIGVCRFDTDQYRMIGVPEQKLLTIPNGMKAVARRTRERQPGERITFITAARFEDQKDYETLAAAVWQLEPLFDKFKLLIYGDGRKEQAVRNGFAGIPASTVEFCGIVRDLAPELDKADVYVLSSHWEGLPRSIIEAMSSQMPVVATDVGGVAELVEHGKTGYLVPPKDVTALAGYMRRYIEQPGEIDDHAAGGRNKFDREYTLERMLDRYVEEYLAPGVREQLSVEYSTDLAAEPTNTSKNV